MGLVKNNGDFGPLTSLIGKSHFSMSCRPMHFFFFCSPQGAEFLNTSLGSDHPGPPLATCPCTAFIRHYVESLLDFHYCKLRYRVLFACTRLPAVLGRLQITNDDHGGGGGGRVNSRAYGATPRVNRWINRHRRIRWVRGGTDANDGQSVRSSERTVQEWRF